jgi:hypothetical protein
MLGRSLGGFQGRLAAALSSGTCRPRPRPALSSLRAGRPERAAAHNGAVLKGKSELWMNGGDGITPRLEDSLEGG